MYIDTYFFFKFDLKRGKVYKYNIYNQRQNTAYGCTEVKSFRNSFLILCFQHSI